MLGDGALMRPMLLEFLVSLEPSGLMAMLGNVWTSEHWPCEPCQAAVVCHRMTYLLCTVLHLILYFEYQHVCLGYVQEDLMINHSVSLAESK